MLTNATILRIDRAPTVGLDNSRTYVEGASTDLRCSWQDPKTGRKWIIGAAIADANAVLYVPGDREADFQLDGRVLIQVDREAATRIYTVLAAKPMVGLGLSNTEVYLKG